ncbi:MAG: DUF1844 domain-containing protein [Acidobacteriota bacterium]
MSEDPQDAFKVTDRRLFNPDGSPREQEAEPEPPVQAAAASAGPSLEVIPEKPIEFAAELSGGPLPSPEAENELESDEDAGGDLTEFMGVLMEFATPAFIHLGLAEHPATGRPEVNLPAAQQAIEMLRVLREKTVGNLSREEDDFFEGLLADLRMRFVSLKKPS